MWFLTNNKVEFEGRTFVQVKRELLNGKIEFGGYVEEKLPRIRGDFWIGKDSYLFGDCEINGGARIRKNCIIKNSKICNGVIVGDNCIIIDSTIEGFSNYSMALDKGCIINKQQFQSVGKLQSDFFKDGKIQMDTYNNNVLLMTDNYCRVNCLTMTYEIAWEYLHNEEKWNFIKSQHVDTPQVYYPDTKKWLYYWCEKQLKRKEGRAK